MEEGERRRRRGGVKSWVFEGQRIKIEKFTICQISKGDKVTLLSKSFQAKKRLEMYLTYCTNLYSEKGLKGF